METWQLVLLLLTLLLIIFAIVFFSQIQEAIFGLANGAEVLF